MDAISVPRPPRFVPMRRGGALIGEAGQQESCRDIADDLADRHGTKELIAGDQLLEQAADPGDLFHVPNENEKARKGDQKGVIDL